MKMIIHKEKFDKIVRVRNLLIDLVIFLIILIFFFILNTANTEKINWGMKIAGISVGGLYPSEVESFLNERYEDFLKEYFFLNYKDSYWQTNPEKLGIETDISTTVRFAFAKKNIFWQLASLFGYNINPAWKINEEKMENFLQKNLDSIHQPAINTSLVYDEEKDNFIVTESKKGIIVDKNKLKKELMRNINNFQKNDIKISLIADYPEVLENETEKAHEKAQELLNKTPIKIMMKEDEKLTEIDKIDKGDFLELIDFGPIIDPDNPDNKILGVEFKQEKIKNYLVSLSLIVNQEPIDAQFILKNNLVTGFALSEEGLRLEIDNNIPLLSRKLLNLSNDEGIQLQINKIQPKITTNSIDNLGITDLLAKGVSNFSGSPKSRIHNIKIGTAKFNGVLIKANEEFSFNKILGEIGPEQGYEPELVIKKDKTVPEYGGGLCQVSTTMFRAAINAGFEITQRYPHAFPVKYYNPQGFDATIYPPFPDLKFINNTPGHILIQTKIDNYDLIFEIYGTDDDRKIEIDGPYQYDIKEDGSMKAKITQKVYDQEENIIIEKIFYSNYKSPALYPVEKNPLE